MEDTTDIKNELEKTGLQVVNVGKLKRTVRTLLMVTIKGTTNINQLQIQVQYLSYTKIKWEHCISKRKFSQCQRCQGWGCATSNYYADSACLKCAGKHLTKNCKKPKTEPAKCATCGGDHPVNATICKVYINRIQ